MLRIKVPKDGQEVTTAQNVKVWLNPQRDITHAFSSYTYTASAMLMREGVTVAHAWFIESGGLETDVEAFDFVMRKFAEETIEGKSLKDAFLVSGYTDLPLRTRLAVGASLIQVLMSAYHHGMVEALFDGKDALKFIPVHCVQEQLGFFQRLGAKLDRFLGRRVDIAPKGGR